MLAASDGGLACGAKGDEEDRGPWMVAAAGAQLESGPDSDGRERSARRPARRTTGVPGGEGAWRRRWTTAEPGLQRPQQELQSWR